MILITKQSKIDDVADRWQYQYFRNGQWSTLFNGSSSKAIYDELRALPPGATLEQVRAIIGNNSWFNIRCDECGQDVDAVVVLGAQDYDHHSIEVCFECLEDAFNLIKRPTVTLTIGRA